MKCLPLSVVVATCSFVSMGAPVDAQSAFIDVGTLGFGSSYLLAVNNHNEAVGYSEVSGLDSNRAMLWRDGQLIDLGVLPGLMLSAAVDINDRGQIVGWSSEYQYAGRRPVLWEDGHAIDITPPGYGTCSALGINKRGDIAGACDSLPGVWRDGTFTLLPTLPGAPFGVASDINDRGVVVGTLGTGTGGSVAVRWVDGTVTALGMPVGARGVAEAVNAHGDVVGYVVTSGTSDFYNPVIWRDDTAVPLAGAWGVVFGYARGINKH